MHGVVSRYPDRARALAWNRMCGAIGFEFSAGRGFGALLKVLVTRSHFIELTTSKGTVDLCMAPQANWPGRDLRLVI